MTEELSPWDPISKLGVSERISNILDSYHIFNIGCLNNFTEPELRTMRGMGATSIKAIKAAIKDLSFVTLKDPLAEQKNEIDFFEFAVSKTSLGLQQQINEMLNKGYRLHGSPLVLHEYLYQGMVRDIKPNAKT